MGFWQYLDVPNSGSCRIKAPLRYSIFKNHREMNYKIILRVTFSWHVYF